jgi:hypothetical protein
MVPIEVRTMTEDIFWGLDIIFRKTVDLWT